MKKSFYYNLAFLLLVNLLVKPAWIFGIEVGVQNTVQAEYYGIYFSLLKLSLLFQALLDFGIGNFNNRSVAQDGDFVKKHLADIFILKMLLSAAYIIITMFCAVFVGTEDFHLLLLLAANQILMSFLLYLRTNISGKQLFKTDSLLSVMDKLLMIFICGWLLHRHREEFTIEWFVYAQSGSLLIALLATATVVGKIHVLPQMRWNTEGIIEIFAKTYPYALLGLLMSVYFHIDAVMLRLLLPDGNEQAGIYAASWRLLDAANNMIGFLFATLLLPIFARLIAEGKNVHELASSGFKTIIFIAVLISTACFFYKREIIALLYHRPDENWSNIFGWLLPSFIGFSTVYIYGTLLTANGSIKTLNIIAFGGMLLNISLNAVLIPRYGALGAAAATLATQGAVAVAHIYAVGKIIPFEINYGQVARFIIFTSVLAGLFYSTKFLSENWILNIATGFALAILFAALLKIIDASKLIVLIKR